jgi:MFS family permease
MMWAAGVLASISSITYPAISAFVSMHSDADKQGLAQGMVTGMRGLCNGLGPAMFGVIFYLFHVDLNEKTPSLPLKPPLLDDNNNTGPATHLEIMPQVKNDFYTWVCFFFFCIYLYFGRLLCYYKWMNKADTFDAIHSPMVLLSISTLIRLPRYT